MYSGLAAGPVSWRKEEDGSEEVNRSRFSSRIHEKSHKQPAYQAVGRTVHGVRSERSLAKMVGAERCARETA